VERSICRQPLCAAVLRRWNERIHTALAQPHDAQVSYEALVAEPAGEVRRLAEALGIVDPVAISRAAARVAKPLS
jgi:LPS sulfotransferase NodH